MTRKSRKSRKINKISLVLGIAVAALSVGVPTALGEGRIAGSPEPDGVAFFKANEMSTLAQQNVTPVSTYRDAGERGAVVSQGEPQWLKALNARSEGLNRKYGLGEFASSTPKVSPELRAMNLRSEALNRQYRLGEFSRSSLASQSPEITPTTSGTEIEWLQVGGAVVIGLFLVLGIGLVVRNTHIRPAH